MTSAPSFRLLPVEATEAMLRAGQKAASGKADGIRAAVTYRAMASAAPVLAEATGWQEMATAPKDGRRVLLWKASTKEHYVAAWIHGDHPGWCTPDGFEIYGSTDWQPLPAPPDPPA